MINETRAVSVKDIGKVMDKLMPQVKGRVDGAKVKLLVSRNLEM